MRGWSKTPDAALIAFSEHMGLSLNEWQCNVIRGLYDCGSSSPYTIASSPIRPANNIGLIANTSAMVAYAQVSRGTTRGATHQCSSGAVSTGTPWGVLRPASTGPPRGHSARGTVRVAGLIRAPLLANHPANL